MKKLLSILILILLVLPLVYADGMIIDPQGYLPENEQVAAINYENGRENLIVGIKTDELRDEKSVWILPVPGDPNDVVIDVVSRIPVFSGRNVITEAKDRVSDLVEFASMFEVYPIISILSRGTFSAYEEAGVAPLTKGIDISHGDVIVYEHIEKHGITTELLGAKSGLDIHVYLAQKGLDFPFKTIPILKEYINKDYTFVVSWINKKEELYSEDAYYPYRYGRTLGIYVSFLTDKIYYPMMPTSVYGSKEIPVTIYVLGYVSPKVYENVKNYVSTNYYKTSYMEDIGDPELKKFFGSLDNSKDIKYTRVDVNAPSKLLTEDFYFSGEHSAAVGYASGLSSLFESNWIKFLFVILLSALTGALMGWFVFRSPKKFALVGLANCLTIIVLIIAIIFTDTKEIDKDLKKKLKSKGIHVVGKDTKRKIAFVVGFSILYLILGWLFGVILKYPLIGM